MNKLSIRRYPDPCLLRVSEPVGEEEIKSGALREIVKEMEEIAYRANAQGLSAPQVGINKRFFIYNRSENIEPVYTPVINPKVIFRLEKFHFEEMCLSVQRGPVFVKRYKKIGLRAIDLEGRQIFIKATNKRISACLQHEIDHLDGILIGINNGSGNK